MKNAALSLVLLLFGVFGVQTQAQTTVTTSTPFICDLASRYPVFSFGQFSCRGIGTEQAGAEYFFWGQPRIEVFTSAYTIGPYTSTLTLTGFTQPANGQPGTYSFNWAGTDNNGVAHNGYASGTWVNQLICGGRGCQWYAPKLLTTSFTIVQ